MNSVEASPSFLVRHPWLFVLFAFLLLLGAWSTLITIALKHAPQRIEFSSSSP
jgi:hypothetical protein